MKRIAMVITTIPFLIILTFSIIAEANTVKVNPSHIYWKSGDNITVNITIMPSEPIAGAQCNVIFNSSILKAVEVKNGGMFDWWADEIVENFTVIDNENGTIENIVAFSSFPINESGIFATIIFQAEGEGIASIELINVTISDENGSKCSATIINGSVVADLTPPAVELIDFPPINIEYTSVHFSWNATDNFSPWQNMSFSYMLYGYDSQWSEWGEIREVSYDNLMTGSYTFMVRARDEAGNIAWLNYSFGVSNNPPAKPQLLYPENGSKDVPLQPILSVFVYDPDDDEMDVGFYDGNGNLIYRVFKVSNGSTVNATIPFQLSGHTTYYWYVVVSDGVYENVSDEWHFTTKNRPPVAENQDLEISEDTPIAVVLSANDADGDTLTYSIASPPSHGTVTGSPPHVTYTPNPDYYGSDSFIFRVDDGFGGFDEGVVSISINPVPDAPSKPSVDVSSYSAYEGETITFYVTATDNDGDKIRYGFDWNGDGSIDEWSGFFDSGEEMIIKHSWNEKGVYPVRVKAEDEQKYESEWSDAILISIEQFISSKNHPPIKPYNPYPSDGATYVDLNITLSWECFDEDGDAISYDVYLGTSQEMNMIASHIPSTSLSVSLEPDTTYFWHVVARDENGASNTSDTWQFTTRRINHAPYVSILSPLNGSKNVSSPVELRVIAYDEDGDTLTVTFYDASTNIAIGSVNVAAGNAASIKWKNLENGKKYSWYVVVSDGDAEEKSSTWYFTTVEMQESTAGTAAWRYLAIIFAIAAIASPLSYFYLRRQRRKKVIAAEEARRCTICLGKFKEGASIVECTCGAVFHKSCATRVKECPECGRKIG